MIPDDAVATLRLLAPARRDYAANPSGYSDVIVHEAAVFDAVADTLAGVWRWAELVAGYAPSWRWHQFGDHTPVVGSSSTETVDDDADIDHDHEDRKGLSGNDRYRKGKESLQWGGRSHGATRRDRNPRGRFIAGNDATRFWSKVTKQPGGCWLWTGGVTSDGYGRFRITVAPGRHRHVKAHRWAYEHLVGPIRPGWTLDHLAVVCSSRACVRPDHLEPVTRAENSRRAAHWRHAHRSTGGTPS